MMQISLKPNRIEAVDFIGSVLHDLKKAIYDSGMTATQVAKKIGVSKFELMSCLSGTSNITAGRIAEICWAIGCSVQLIVVSPIKDKAAIAKMEES